MRLLRFARNDKVGLINQTPTQGESSPYSVEKNRLVPFLSDEGETADGLLYIDKDISWK
jgi:hypothetical protein